MKYAMDITARFGLTVQNEVASVGAEFVNCVRGDSLLGALAPIEQAVEFANGSLSRDQFRVTWQWTPESVWSLGAREDHGESGAFSDLAPDLDSSTVSFDNAIADGQSQPCSIHFREKKGSKMRSRFSSGMPIPVSVSVMWISSLA
jgi:hypothetical protein